MSLGAEPAESGSRGSANGLRVALVNSLYEPYALGGTERVVELLASGLASAGHETVVVTLHPGEGIVSDRVGPARVVYVGLHNLYWPFSDPEVATARKVLWHAADSWNPTMARALGDVLRSERVDVVNTHNLVGFSVAAWREIRRLGLPIVHTLHDAYLVCIRGALYRNDRVCERRCADCALYGIPRRLASGDVDAVIGVSRFILALHERFGRFEDVWDRRVIYNPIPPAPKVETIVAEGPMRIGYLGRLAPAKGVEVLTSAVRGLPSGRWRLRLAGSGAAGYVRGLREAAGPDTEILGPTDRDGFFADTDVLVVPSVRLENAPMVIGEAQARGVAVVGSRRGGIPELVEDGETGLLFDPDRPEELTAALASLLADPALVRGLGERGRERVRRRHAPERVADAYAATYRDAIDRSSGRRSG